MNLNELIKKERERQGISAWRLSKRIDTSPTNYGKIESGKHNPSMVIIQRIATELNADITFHPNNKVTITHTNK